MSSPFLGQLKIVAFDFPPRGYALCNGQLLSINQNQGLFSLLGTTFGGDGIDSFALPDLRTRVAVHAGGSVVLGEVGGEQGVTINGSQLPTHSHALQGVSDAATTSAPVGNYLAQPLVGMGNIYAPANDLTAMSPGAISPSSGVEGVQPHNNMQPYLVVNFVIALQGIFPSRS